MVCNDTARLCLSSLGYSTISHKNFFAGYGQGAGHGGQGGAFDPSSPSPAYNSVFSPLQLGSGGGKICLMTKSITTI